MVCILNTTKRHHSVYNVSGVVVLIFYISHDDALNFKQV